jgi:CO dehydrogenase/acetyl-CoA synthase beta subunit
LENKAAIKLVDKILENLDNTGINTDALISDIKELRGFALEEQLPLVVKVLRLTYEHIEENNSFLIPVLEEEEARDESNDVEVQVENMPVESLKYLILLIRNLNNKINISDLKEYKDLLINF